MKHVKRFLSTSVLLLGVVGCLACIALSICVLVLNLRLSSLTETIYSDVDDLFSKTQDRVRQLDAAVEMASASTSDVSISLNSLNNRLAEELTASEQESGQNLAPTMRGLAETLANANGLAEVSADTIALMLNVVEIANRAGAEIEEKGLGQLQQDILRLRNRIGQAAEDVANLSARVNDDALVSREQIRAITEGAAELLATLDVVQASLDRLDQRLTDTRQQVAKSKPQLLGWINVVTACVIFLLLWMFAGQLTLGRSGWHSMRGGGLTGR